MLEYALKYAALGWAIFPCRPNDKRPATSHGCLDATTDADQIREWWTKIPDLNIGLACGEISGITALDIDPRSNGHTERQRRWPHTRGYRQLAWSR